MPEVRLRSILSKRAGVAAVSVALAATLIPVASAAGATTSHRLTAQQQASASKPTIVLVHGAWADSSSWSSVIRILARQGYPVIAAPNPLRGLSYDTATLKDFLATISGPIVLVGHSYGGAVITDAATGNANVKALVYDDAYLPASGEDISTLSSAQSALAPALHDPTSVFKLVEYPNPPAATVVDTYLLPKVVYTDFAPDISHARARVLWATQSPTSLAALGEPSTTPAWKSIPSWAVIGRQDKIIPLAAQLEMAHRAGAHITEINSSHVSLISHPYRVAKVIVAAARATD